MTFLNTILESKRTQIDALPSLDVLQQRVTDFERSDIRIPLWSDSLDVIAEIKRRSPSKGDLADINDPAVLARTYENGGAAIISVLTDQEYFGARDTDFDSVRNAVKIPVLRKDFIIDVKQVFETYLMGADVMLLIVAAFDNVARLSELHDCALALGMSVLVETHSLAEIEIANDLGAQLIGVNVRDLTTFAESPELGDDLISQVRPDATSVWESSISSVDDAKRARAAGADVVLVGQGLVQHENPGGFIEQIRNIS